MCMSVCLLAGMHAHHMCAWGSQSRLDPLGVMLLLVIGCWELYLDPLQAQQVLLTAETSFQSPEFRALQKFWFAAVLEGLHWPKNALYLQSLLPSLPYYQYPQLNFLESGKASELLLVDALSRDPPLSLITHPTSLCPSLTPVMSKKAELQNTSSPVCAPIQHSNLDLASSPSKRIEALFVQD